MDFESINILSLHLHMNTVLWDLILHWNFDLASLTETWVGGEIGCIQKATL